VARRRIRWDNCNTPDNVGRLVRKWVARTGVPCIGHARWGQCQVCACSQCSVGAFQRMPAKVDIREDAE